MEESVCLKRNLNEAKVQATILKDKLSIQNSFYFTKRNKSVNQSTPLCLVLRMTFSQIS